MKKFISTAFALIISLISFAQTATINKVWHESKEKDYEDCLCIHADFVIRGQKGKQAECIVFFYDENKDNLKTDRKGHQTKSDEACVWRDLTPSYDNSHWEDLKLYMPIDAINPKPGKHTYYYRVKVRDEGHNSLTQSDYIAFSVTGKAKDPNKIDNSKLIRVTEAKLAKLRYDRQKCYGCHGTGKAKKSCGWCAGWGWTGYGSRSMRCVTCNGTGQVSTTCYACTDIVRKIMISENLLKNYKATHGMSKENEEFYYKNEAWLRQMEADANKARDEMVDSYLNKSSKSSSSSSSSKTSTCTLCGGTGYDSYAWDDPLGNVRVGGMAFTNYEGNKCTVCGKFTWHQHQRCTRCNVR